MHSYAVDKFPTKKLTEAAAVVFVPDEPYQGSDIIVTDDDVLKLCGRCVWMYPLHKYVYICTHISRTTTHIVK